MSELDPRIGEKMYEEKHEPSAPEPESKSTVLLWMIAAIAIVVLAIFAIRYFNSTAPHGEIVTDHGFEFEKRAGLWRTTWEVEPGTQLLLDFHFLPEQAANISIHASSSWDASKFDNDNVVIAIDPRVEDQTYTQLSAAEIAFKLAALGANVSVGYTTNATGDFPDRPIVNCNTPNTSVIIINHLNITAGLQFEKTCIQIYGYEDELVRAVDRFLYTLYGILPVAQ